MDPPLIGATKSNWGRGALIKVWPLHALDNSTNDTSKVTFKTTFMPPPPWLPLSGTRIMIANLTAMVANLPHLAGTCMLHAPGETPPTTCDHVELQTSVLSSSPIYE